MIHAAMILLTGFVTQTKENPEILIRDSLDLYAAPRVAPIPPYVSEPRYATEDGIWLEAPEHLSWGIDGNNTPEGVFMPKDLNDAMRDRWLTYEGLPGVFQVQLDVLKQVHFADLEEMAKVTLAREKHRVAKRVLEASNNDWGWVKTTLYALVVTAAIGCGALIGWTLRGATTMQMIP